MATSPIKLAINLQDGTIVSVNGSAGTLPTLFQYNTPDFELTFVNPAANQITATNPYVAQDMSAYTLRVAVGPTPTGTSGGPTPWIVQTTWTYDATNKKFVGSIPLTSASIDSAIGTAPSVAGTFEINLRQSGIPITAYQGAVTIKAALDEGVSTTPPVGDVYMTAAEIIARFLEKGAVLGEIKVWYSADGTKKRLQYLGDDGEMKFDLVS